MIQKICDRCKKGPSESDKVYKPYQQTLTFSWEIEDPKEMGYWLNRNKSIDLCQDCFNDFMNYIETKNE